MSFHGVRHCGSLLPLLKKKKKFRIFSTFCNLNDLKLSVLRLNHPRGFGQEEIMDFREHGSLSPPEEQAGLA